jgi:hypothetical protein
LLVDELGENFLRALQAFGLFGEAPHPSLLLGAAFQAFYVATLPMCGSVGFVEPLNATPGEGSNFYRFSGHRASSSI